MGGDVIVKLQKLLLHFNLPYALPNLATLICKGRSQDLSLALTAFSNPSLRSVQIQSGLSHTGHLQVHRLLVALSTWVPVTLHRLVIQLEESDHGCAKCTDGLTRAVQRQENLQELEIFCGLLDCEPAVLWPRCDTLRKLSFIQFAGNEARVPPCLSSIAINCPNVTELLLGFEIAPGGFPDDVEFAFRFDVLEPLMSLTNMTNFRLITTPPLSLTPSNVMALGRAWPKLEHLHILPATPSTPAPKTPLAVLGDIARSFGTTLSTLRLSFSALSSVTANGPERTAPGFKKLTKLTLVDTFIYANFDTVLKLGEYLASLVPETAQLCVAARARLLDDRQPDIEMSKVEPWDRVRNAVAGFHRARADAVSRWVEAQGSTSDEVSVP